MMKPFKIENGGYMKEVKHYICDICNTEYNNIEQCEKCEKSHKKPIEITKSSYLSITQNQKGYPNKIYVSFDDGRTVEYKR